MSHPLQRFSVCVLVVALVGWSSLPMAFAQGTKIPGADEVKGAKAKYDAEKAAIVKAGSASRFLPTLLDKADAMAKRGDAALAAGRLLQASEAFRQARWQLPYQPGHVPDHVSRIIGNLRLRHGGGINALAFSADGQRLATASADTTVKVWDLGNGHEVCRFTGHADIVRHVAFSPDGKTVLSAGAERDLKLWDATTGKETSVIKGALARVTAMSLSKDGKHLVAAHANEPGKNPPNQLCVYEVAGGKRLRETDFPATISSLAFNAAGTIVAAGDEQGRAHLWDYPAIADAPNKPAYWTQEDPTGAAKTSRSAPTAKPCSAAACST